MTIELEYRGGVRDFPFPYDVETNEPNLHIIDYVIFRQKYPKRIHPQYRKASAKTIRDSISRIVFFINRLAEQKIEDPETGESTIGVHYLRATFNDNMEPIINALRNGNGDPDAAWKEASIEQYVKAWRSFYRFLTLTHVEHMMHMPDTISFEGKNDIDNNFLSHTAVSHTYRGEIETAIDSNNKEFSDDYCDSVLSMDDFWSLYAFLYEDDPVYSAMLFAQTTTLLRASALINDFTLTPTALNKNFLTYPQVERNEELYKQPIFYVKKGGKKGKTFLSREVHALLHHEYIAPKIDKGIGITPMSYAERLKRYKEKCQKHKKWGADKDPTAKPTWIKQTGTPVSYREYQYALERASDALGIKIHSHMCRHTGATQILWRYLKMHNKTACHTNDLMVNDAHKILQEILGHKNVETTKRYVLTIERMILENQMDDMLNYTFAKSKEHYSELTKKNPNFAHCVNALESASQRLDGFMLGRELTQKTRYNQ
ncbi:MAG: site-specific integrase [Pseudomonadota bacterium]|nr:hypothetical protein KUL118_45770 [Tenacibaculum sp. KUL118]